LNWENNFQSASLVLSADNVLFLSTVILRCSEEFWLTITYCRSSRGLDVFVHLGGLLKPWNIIIQKQSIYADKCTMCTYEKIMHSILAIFALWFSLTTLGQLSVFSDLENSAGVVNTANASNCGENHKAKAKEKELLSRLSALLKSETGKSPVATVSIMKSSPVSDRENIKKKVVNSTLRAKSNNIILEDVFVSRKDGATRLDLQFSGEIAYSLNHQKEKRQLHIALKGLLPNQIKANFPPLTVLSSVRFVGQPKGEGTTIELMLAEDVAVDISDYEKKSERIRLSFKSNVISSESNDGRLIASKQQWLGEGLSYVRYRYKPQNVSGSGGQGSNFGSTTLDNSFGSDVHLLRYSLASKEFGIGFKLAKDKIPGKARLSEIAKPHIHVAAVNASFFSGTGEPLGLLSSKRKLLSVPVFQRSSFGIFNGERALLGNPGFSGKVITDTGEFDLMGINQTGAGVKGKMMVYTPEFGASTKTKGSGLELAIADGRIVAVQENDTPVPPNGFVVGIRGEPLPEMAETKFWDKVRFKWGLTPPWDVADFAVGGGPMLLEDFEEKVTWKEERFSRAFAVTPAPRTAVGIDKDGGICLVVADGRDKKRNRGLTLSELAQVMRKVGCKSAVNLDGGGSSTMWINGEIVNRPSDGRERKISSAIVLTRQSQSMYASSGVSDGMDRGI